MKTILIHPQDIVANSEYMHDKHGRHDLLGQILFTGYGVQIPMKCRTPQELPNIIPPFSTLIRRYVTCNTPLTLELLSLSSLSGKRQVIEANKLLAPHKIRLITEQELEYLQLSPREDDPRTRTIECGMCGELVEHCQCDELDKE